MRCSHKLIAFATCLLFGATSIASKKEEKAREEAAKESKKEASKKKGKNAAKNDKADAGKESDKMQIPLVPGHDSLGLKIPYTSRETGKLQMMYTIGVANLPDPDHMKMVDAQVETFGEDGKHEMLIDLPDSILDLNTKILTTNRSVTIKHADFELTGQTMEFNTITKQGTLGGGVRMLIYNLENEEAAKPEKKENE
ncbi:MAG: LPS export ABC transporter periplasmic protein LptC [Verrucomicrobiota bacterium]